MTPTPTPIRSIPAALGALALSAALAAPADAGLRLRDIESREQSATAFTDFAANEQVPDGTLPGVVFSDPGTVMFLQSGPFYLEDSNRSWGFAGEGSAIIKLPADVSTVTIAARGSSAKDSTGPLFGSVPLAPAKGAIHALDDAGRRVRSVKLDNVSLRGPGARLISFKSGATQKGPRIVALELENRAKADNSLVVIGGLGLTRSRAADCPADTNRDGLVDGVDLVAVLSAIGGTDTKADVDGDGAVTANDLVETMKRLGTCR